jgi:glycosyltransferase involved in cell wall biosynthesis
LANSPYPNTLLYKKSTIGCSYTFEKINYIESFLFNKSIHSPRKSSGMLMLLPLNECGYVCRFGINNQKTYSIENLKDKSIEEQTNFLTSMPVDEQGVIELHPHWRVDYTEIIKRNVKMQPPSELYPGMLSLLEATKSPNIKRDGWQSVKFSWENAEKFIASIDSRGIGSTISNLLGINNTGGNRVEDEIYQQRKSSCFGDVSKNIEPCSNLKHVNAGYFCGTCGCGDKKLAKLNSDIEGEYTKLHYPDLQCPLKKVGFSNYESQSYLKSSDSIPPISIIIPVLNDNDELNLTIKSIRETSPPNVEIIVVDDASDLPVKINDSTVRFFRFNERLGAGQARHFGAKNATSDLILFTDSHMRFDPKWYNNAISKILMTPTTLWCGTCLGLDESNMDIKYHKGAYNGADLVIYAEKNNTIFDGVWRDEILNQDDYEISCVMGACYFIHKKWYFHIKGLEQTMMWGSEEPILSIKSWLAGGDVRLMKSVRIGHRFRNTSPYINNVSHIFYNKLAYMYMLFPTDMFVAVTNKMTKDENFESAMKLVENKKEMLDIEREYYKTIFSRDIYWLCNKFNIKIPE